MLLTLQLRLMRKITLQLELLGTTPIVHPGLLTQVMIFGFLDLIALMSYNAPPAAPPSPAQRQSQTAWPRALQVSMAQGAAAANHAQITQTRPPLQEARTCRVVCVMGATVGY